MRQHSGMDSKQYTLHNLAMEALKLRDFMREGGTLGFYCQHADAHTNQSLDDNLPYALKGVDAVFYSIFYHMDLDVDVKPVLDLDASRYRYDDTNADEDGDLIGTAFHGIKLANTGGYEDEGTIEVRTSPAPYDFFKPIGSPKTLSRDSRAVPESIVLT